MDIQRYVVTFRYQEESLADPANLTNQLTLAGFTTTLTDEQGVLHELGSNSYGVTGVRSEEETRELAERLGETALGRRPEVTLETLADYLAQIDQTRLTPKE
ncbi:type V toxin-antitoxin system endoribonuclease antitoxin GhoS [Nissabacter sp. SGAir0207]|uniref:type V toxin-antitoxin system endoribonuclease antitoxin GhoS n=1 Tax=Nissabacter sp. SGAir0207 TaxID=2126321 RepID=UPI0010CD2C5A|nr:type V toxin-antitoxin system endoribonuclease antitoxin GhoS [Nissabacter sp. SGAir0207]QCR36320.1 hypothetical protein C1N62_09540 [Nissabacter sp. SGAir0207]